MFNLVLHTVRGGIGYDFVNLKSAESDAPGVDAKTWRANAFGAEFAVTYDFSDTFQLYVDSMLGFYNKFKVGNTEYTKDNFSDKVSFLSTAEHTGVAYNIDLGNNMNLQVGAGLAFEYARITGSDNDGDTTETAEIGIYSFGVGLYANFDYSFSEKFALAVTVHPDLMFVSGDHASFTTSTVIDNTVTTVSNSTTTFGAGTSFKFNASVGVKFAF